MTRSQLDDAFGHHAWATQRLLDTCMQLDEGQLRTTSPGTFGSIIDTFRHLVGADCGYLHALSAGTVPLIDDGDMSLSDLRQVMTDNEAEWKVLLGKDLDSEVNVIRYRADGSEGHAPAGIRVAQALHHGTDHRSQICTILTTLGVEPPAIDVWDYAEKDGRLTEVPPA